MYFVSCALLCIVKKQDEMRRGGKRTAQLPEVMSKLSLFLSDRRARRHARLHEMNILSCIVH